MKNWFCACLLTLSIGCASAVVRPYVGEQQNWPTATGSIVNTRYALPIFTSLPPSAYDLVGELRISSPFYPQPEEGHLPMLVKEAQKLDADAIVFVDGQVYFSTNYGPKPTDANAAGGGGAAATTLTQVNTFNPDLIKPGVTILAIKWKDQPPAGLPAKFLKGTPSENRAKAAALKQQEAPADITTKAAAPAPAPVPPPPVPAPAPTPVAAPATPAPAPVAAPAAAVAPAPAPAAAAAPAPAPAPAQPVPSAPADTNAPPAPPVQFH